MIKKTLVDSIGGKGKRWSMKGRGFMNSAGMVNPKDMPKMSRMPKRKMMKLERAARKLGY